MEREIRMKLDTTAIDKKYQEEVNKKVHETFYKLQEPTANLLAKLNLMFIGEDGIALKDIRETQQAAIRAGNETVDVIDSLEKEGKIRPLTAACLTMQATRVIQDALTLTATAWDGYVNAVESREFKKYLKAAGNTLITYADDEEEENEG